MILSDLWIMGKRKRLRECSLIFIMGKFKILRLCVDGTDRLKMAWLCGFLNVFYPGIIALMWEVQILRYNILLSYLLDTDMCNLLYHLWDSKSSQK